MLPPDHLAVPYKEHLHHRITAVHSHSQHIFILTVAVGDLLPLGDLVDALDQIAVFDRLFKFHVLRRFIHLFFQHGKNRSMVSVQKLKGLIYRFPVLFFCDLSLTRRIALPDVVIKAGSFFSYVPRKVAVAPSELIQLLHQFDGIFHCTRTGIRPEISGFILFHPAREKHSGVFFP